MKSRSTLLVALLVTLSFVPAFAADRVTGAPMVLEAYLAVDIPPTRANPCDEQFDAWRDTPRYQEPVTGATVAFKHDGEYLYFSAVWPVSDPSYRDYFGVEFDNNGDGVHMGDASSPDDAIFLSPSFRMPPFGCARDAFLSGFAQPTYDADAGGVNDLVGRMVYLNGSYYIEVKKPFVSNDTAGHDIALAMGMSVGIGLAAGAFGAGASHLATDMSSYMLELTEKQSATVPEVRITSPVDLAYDLGILLLLATAVLVAFHFVRRRAWRRSPRFVGAAATAPLPYVLVRRHALPVRAMHWAHAALMITLLATGFAVHWRVHLFGPATTVVHVGVGLTILFLDIPVRFLVLKREKELRVLAQPMKEDFREIGVITANLFGLNKKYPEHSTFDTKTRRYFQERKYCAFQKAMLWGDLAGIVAIAITGMALYTDMFGWIVDLLGGSLNVRAVHLLLFFYFAATLTGHVYLSAIPYNWGKMNAMVKGVGRVREHVPAKEKGSSPAPAPAGQDL